MQVIAFGTLLNVCLGVDDVTCDFSLWVAKKVTMIMKTLLLKLLKPSLVGGDHFVCAWNAFL